MVEACCFILHLSFDGLWSIPERRCSSHLSWYDGLDDKDVGACHDWSQTSINLGVVAGLEVLASTVYEVYELH